MDYKGDDMSLISVIIPVYNTADYVGRCIQSVLAQSYKDFEVIIIDDGSTDQSGTICKKFAASDARIRYYHIDNSGVSAARNKAIELVNGEFLLFVDSDDYIDKSLMEQLIRCQRHYNCDLVKFSATISPEFNRTMDIPSYTTQLYTSGEALKEFFYGDETKIKVQVWSGLYKKALFDDIRFPVGKVYEDSYVTPQILAISKKIVYLDYPGYIYYMRDDSIMHSGLSEDKVAAYDLYKELYFRMTGKCQELRDILAQKWVFQYIYTYRDILKQKKGTFPGSKAWLNRIYCELKADKLFLLEHKLSPSCKKQLYLFLISPFMFNLYIDLVDRRIKG